MEALNDITEGAAEGVFSTILVGNILALRIFADRIETKEMTIRQGTEPMDGTIHSANWAGVDGNAGWLIDYLGNAYFKKAYISGEFKTGSNFDSAAVPTSKDDSLYAGNGKVSLVNPKIYGDCTFGLPSPHFASIGWGWVEFKGPRLARKGDTSCFYTNRMIYGSYTVSGLYQLLQGFNIENFINDYIPCTGTIAKYVQTGGGQGGAVYGWQTLILSCLETANGYCFYGHNVSTNENEKFTVASNNSQNLKCCITFV
jgi:hypothetical protein